MRDLLVKADDGTPAVTHAPTREGERTFADAAAEWLRYVEQDKQRRPSTLRDYRSTVNGCVLLQLGPETPLDQITTRTIDQLRENLLAAGMGWRSVQKTLVLLHGIRARERLEWIGSTPAENAERASIKRSGDISNVLSPEEVLATAGTARSERDSAVILVAAFTIGELRGLRWSDVDFALERILWQSSLRRRVSPERGEVCRERADSGLLLVGERPGVSARS